MSSNQDPKDIMDQKLSFGPWNEQETLKYLVFLDQNKIIMSSKQKKKKFRVFDQMSEFVQTRTSLQCRSHHQKATQKYKEVKMIILHEKRILQSINYRLKFKELRHLAKIKQDYPCPPSNQKVQRNISEIQLNELPRNTSNEAYSPAIMPSYFNMPNYIGMMRPHTYQMLPMESMYYYTNLCFYPPYQNN